MTRRLLLIVPALAILASACQPSSAVPAAQGPVIAATNTILADIAQHVAGDTARVESLLPAGVDPHEYQASPADVQKLSKSSVLILNGLEYERFMEPVLENAGGVRRVIVASEGLAPQELEDIQGPPAADPHMWLDPLLVIRYVENIRNGLSQADPPRAASYEANAAGYIAELQALDGWIREQVSLIPLEQRLLITNHGSMSYFADRYGFQVVTQLIPSVSTGAGSSARQLAAVIDKIKESRARAVFLGELENPDLAQQIAAETEVVIVDDLYLESLSPGPPAGSYIDLMKHNVGRIVQALR